MILLFCIVIRKETCLIYRLIVRIGSWIQGDMMCDFDCRFKHKGYCELFDDVLSFENCIFKKDEEEEE